MTSWTIIQLDRGLGEHASAWDALLRRLFKPNPMLESRFVDALLAHFGDGTERLCIWHSDGVMQAMCIVRRHAVGVWESFLPDQTQLGAVLMGDAHAVPDLLRLLPGVNFKLDFLCNDPDFGNLHDPTSSRVMCQDHVQTISIDLSGSFEDYWRSRSKNLTHNINRYRRRLDTEGIDTHFKCIDAVEEIAAGVARYAALESQGWKGKLGTALAVGDAQTAFYSDVLTRFAAAGCGVVFELWFDDRLAASRLAIITGHTLVILKTTFDEAFTQFAPGRVMLRKVIKHCFTSLADGRIEFYTNANAAQLAWATESRWIQHTTVYRHALTANLAQLANAVRHTTRDDAEGTVLAKSNLDQALVSIDVFTHPGELPEDVRQLFANAEYEHLEFGLSWFNNLIDTVYPGDPGVRIFVLRHKGRPVAAMPVRSGATRWGNVVEALGNYYTALYAPAVDPQLRPHDLAPLLKSIRTTFRPASRFMLGPMDPHSPIYALLKGAFQTQGWVTFPYFCFGNWYSAIGTNWQQYSLARPGATRNSIKRNTKKFANDGGYIELLDGSSNVDRAIDAWESVYASSWKVAEPFLAFMPGLIRTSAQQGWLRMAIAWLNDKPVAAQVWLVHGGKAKIYKLAYDENHKNYAPGTLLTAKLMEHVIDTDAVTEVDYLIGDDPYKVSWVDSRRERWGIVAYDPKTIGGMFESCRELVANALKKGNANLGTTTHGAHRPPLKSDGRRPLSDPRLKRPNERADDPAAHCD